MASGMSGVINCELRDAVMKIRNANLFRAFLQDVVETPEIERLKILAVRMARPILDRAGYADHTLDAGVIRGNLRVSEGPIHVVTIERGGAEIDFAEASGGSSPKIGFSADGPAAWPGPLGPGRSRVPDFMFPHARHPFAVHVTNGLRALRRIAEPAELHLPGFAMAAKILGRIEPPSGVDAADFEAGFAERLDGHAAAGAASNHNDVIDLFWHRGSPFRRRQMFVFGVS